MAIKDTLSKFVMFFNKHKGLTILMVIFIAHLFFRFYLLSERLSFGWDQVDNAWAAKSIIVDHKYPLLGMVAKGNSGFNIGPLYYYLIAIVYWVFRLNPIASGVTAGLTSIFTFFVIYFVTKKLFSQNIALIAVGIHTVSNYIIVSDRSQWPVNLIAPVSFLVFYALYNVMTGKAKYLVLLALAIGFSFHIHFTSIFYPIIVLLSLPFFPWKKKNLKYIFLSIPIFLLFLIPNILAEVYSKNSQTNSLVGYLNTYYHGFHLTRVLQLAHDAFVEFQLIMMGWFHDLNYLLVIAFFIIFFLIKTTRKKFILSYLIALWFVVPWFVFATYKGEISNYYFFSTRPIAILILAYLTYWIFSFKNYLSKIAIVIFWLYFSYVNIGLFFSTPKGDMKEHIANAKSAIEKRQFIDAFPYTPESYLYYYYSKVDVNKK
jgi:4-amino-4-deoxy-L-arabinose transferase-like glycosyltransferase